MKKVALLKPPVGKFARAGSSIADLLVGAWLMNEDGGWKIWDSSRRENHGSIPDGYVPSRIAGPYGSALGFTAGNKILISTKPDFQVTDYFTVMVWMMDDATAGNHCFIAKANVPVANGWLMRTNTPRNLIFSPTSGGDCTGSATLSSTVYQQVTSVFDNGTVRLFVNGIQDGSDFTTRTITSNSLDLVFGCSVSEDYWFVGKISHGYFWRRALKNHEIRTLYHEPFLVYGVNRGVGQVVAAPPAEPKPITIETRTAGPRKFQHHVFE